MQLVAEQTGRDPKDVYAHTMFLRGGFGGNGAGGTGVTHQTLLNVFPPKHVLELDEQFGRTE